MTDPSDKRLFCFGLGYSAQVLVNDLRAEGWRIAGTCREPDRAEDLRREGIDIHLFDGTAPMQAAAAALAGTTHLLISVPPDESGDPVLRWHAADIGALMKATPRLAWAAYLSTTGVYGDRAGDWVGEASARLPTGERGRRRVAAEDGWLALWREHGVPVHLFRLAGIYGPGRNALDTVRAGKARRIDKPGQVFSRIHVEDIAGTVLMAITQSHGGATYNVADDLPAATAEVVAYACELLGKPVPPAIPWEQIAPSMSAMARSFYAENRRVRNDRIKDELGVVLRYPTYREGLRAIAAAVIPSAARDL